MGLVTANTVGLSGIVAPKPNVQTFTTTSGTWTKPPGCTRVYIECIGAGGGGGGGHPNASGAGGGGGAMTRGIYDADALPATLTVAAGLGGAKGESDHHGTYSSGTAGGTSSVTDSGTGFQLKAYGGGGGGRQDSGSARAGGGGGGGSWPVGATPGARA